MVNRNVNISITLNPREIEAEIWKMSSVEQADLILAMTQRFHERKNTVSARLNNLMDGFGQLNGDERREAITFFQGIVDTLKEADRENTKLEQMEEEEKE